MKLWRVDVELTLTAPCYVLADTLEAAIADAQELVSVTDWEWDEESEYFAKSDPDLTDVDDLTPVWTGGPDGKDITIGEWRKGAKA